MPNHLFLYGTLRPEIAPEELRPLLERLEAIGSASLPGHLHDLGPYPGLVPDPEEGPVQGAVFRLPAGPEALEEILEDLDAYEGYDPRDEEGSLFLRRRASVTLEAGGELEAWVYVYGLDPAAAPRIEPADYLAYLARRGGSGKL